MTTSLMALTGYVIWTVLLVLTVVSYRSLLVLSGKKRADEFPRGRPYDISPFIERVVNAHMNCVENLPLVAAIILIAAVSDKSNITDPLAMWLLAARLGQSGVHLIAVNHWMVMVRVTFFLAQLAILLYWALALLGMI